MSNTPRAYCVKCKTKRDMADSEAVYTRTGTPGTRGVCPVCGTNLFRMGETAAHAHVPKPEKVEKPKREKSKSAKKKPGSRKNTGKLVIVESPAKARSVGHFLGRDYTVAASKGHVRDLLVSQLSVDVENNFEPKYRVPNDKRSIVRELRSLVEGADQVYLATDPDREGEAIAWHLIAAADIDSERARRVVFHEITGNAVQHAFQHTRAIDDNLVNAQQARRILDRLVGYNVTELLWEKVRNQLSAGRVQSIALRLVVDREREVEAFTPEEYWTLDARLQQRSTNGEKPEDAFLARLVKIDGEDVAFGEEGDVRPHLDVLRRSRFTVTDVKRGSRQRRPSPPFTTSTLQQEASRRLGFNARRTMAVAQQLYEGIQLRGEGVVGLITYMRTDSVNVSAQAQGEARAYIQERYGKAYLPAKAPTYKTRTRGAQEAHEAIRPTGVARHPDDVRQHLTRDQLRLYTLIWQRFVASQMANAVYDTLRADILAGPDAGKIPYEFRFTGSAIKFAGFLVLYEEARDDDEAGENGDKDTLPNLTKNELLDLLELLPEQHFTQPPPRFTEASLVRALEENGIGRPSTYAPTVAIIQDREYVTKQDKRLIPTEIGKTVNDLLVQFFPEIMDYQFTARMEDQLDTVAEGNLEWQPMLAEFYTPFEHALENARKNMPQVRQEEAVGRDCPVCGNALIVRYGRYGKFIGCSNYPECKHTEPWVENTTVPCPECGQEHGGQIVVRKSRRGRTFYGCSRYPDCEYTSWKRPLPQPCPDCGGLLVQQSRDQARCTVCGQRHKLDELPEASAEPA